MASKEWKAQNLSHFAALAEFQNKFGKLPQLQQMQKPVDFDALIRKSLETGVIQPGLATPPSGPGAVRIG